MPRGHRGDREGEENLLQGRWVVEGELGHGSEGTVYIARDVNNDELVAIKRSEIFDYSDSETDDDKQNLEMTVLEAVGNKKGYPKVHWMGNKDDYHLVVMELLGPSLRAMLPEWGHHSHLDDHVTLKIAIHCIEALRVMHKEGFVHIDIKPQNMCLARGSSDGRMVVKLIDFGIAKRWRGEDGKHVAHSTGGWMCGSIPYASVANHRGEELSRRDDIEGLAYVLLYFVLGKLPWRDTKTATTDTARTHKYKYVGREKDQADAARLFAGHDPAFVSLLETARSMGFEEEPKYDALLKKLRASLKESCKTRGDEYTEEILVADLPAGFGPVHEQWMRDGVHLPRRVKAMRRERNGGRSGGSGGGGGSGRRRRERREPTPPPSPSYSYSYGYSYSAHEDPPRGGREPDRHRSRHRSSRK